MSNIRYFNQKQMVSSICTNHFKFVLFRIFKFFRDGWWANSVLHPPLVFSALLPFCSFISFSTFSFILRLFWWEVLFLYWAVLVPQAITLGKHNTNVRGSVRVYGSCLFCPLLLWKIVLLHCFSRQDKIFCLIH